MAASRMVLADGRHLAWREYGKKGGFPVVFAHGNLNSSQFAPLWAKTCDVTAECGARVYALDRPGYGDSCFKADRDYASMASDVKQWMQAQSIDTIAVLGYSSGGPNALAIAAGLGDSVACCGLFSTDGPYKEMGLNPRMFNCEALTYEESVKIATKNEADLRASYEKAKPERKDLLLGDIDHATKQGVDKGPSQDSVLESADWGIDLGAVRCPVLLYHGADDTDVPPECATHLAQKIPHAELSIVEGENHSMIRRKWKEVLSAVLAKCHPTSSL